MRRGKGDERNEGEGKRREAKGRKTGERKGRERGGENINILISDRNRPGL